MFSLFQHRPYRLILTANLISMFGSGLNHAAVIWFVLARTHSESSVALLVNAITLPSLFFLPFSGVLIDRSDRRYTTMILDSVRGIAVAAMAALALSGHIQTWHVYAMGVVLGLGAFMFWPNMAALTQELVDPKDVVPLNALVMGTAQAGWMLAGAAVGFLYDRIGLGGVLAIDATTYLVSVLLMLRLRPGKHLVHSDTTPMNVAAFNRDFIAGLRYMAGQPRVLVLSVVSALFVAAMMSMNVITAPLSMKILHAGARGFGFCNAGWSVGAIAAGVLTGTILRHSSSHLQVMSASLVMAAIACAALPHSVFLSMAVTAYFVMGASRGMAGVGINSALMREVPKQLMGRTQNVMNFTGIVLQIVLTMAVGWLSEHMTLALGCYSLAAFYLTAGALAWIV